MAELFSNIELMFHFLIYIQPAWYYRLADQTVAPLLADVTRLTTEDRTLIDPPPAYQDPQSAGMDAAFQGLLRGIIPGSEQALEPEKVVTITHVGDNYRFVRRYYGLKWSLYIYLLRLVTFHQPFRETGSFLKSINIKGVHPYSRHKVYTDYEQFDSPLVRSAPRVSVVIPTLNRYEYLKDVLTDLEKQAYRNFEVLVCDQSEPIQETIYQETSLDLKLIRQSEKALWLARNRCIEQADGSYILLFDDDSRVEPDWITEHLKCVDYFGVRISAGVTHTLVGHGLSPKETYFHLSDVFDTGNALVHKDVFKRAGMFDRQFEKQRMGDGEFGMRAVLSGEKIISNYKAMRIHLKVETGGLRQMGSWDALRPKKLLAPRPVPSVLYFIRTYFGSSAALSYLAINLPSSFIPYKWKKSRALKALSFLLMPFYLPLIVYVGRSSWNKATSMLKKGRIA
jgi:glycosyltransferase involved in cell wall biosynthesis